MVGRKLAIEQAAETRVSITFHSKSRPPNPYLIQLEPKALTSPNKGQV
jgi:hypothetical protein